MREQMIVRPSIGDWPRVTFSGYEASDLPPKPKPAEPHDPLFLAKLLDGLTQGEPSRALLWLKPRKREPGYAGESAQVSGLRPRPGRVIGVDGTIRPLVSSVVMYDDPISGYHTP